MLDRVRGSAIAPARRIGDPILHIDAFCRQMIYD
jgi:hypothetical protein